MDRFYILQSDDFKHILPTKEEIEKYGKSISNSNHLGLDTRSVQEKAKRHYA